MVYKCTLLHSYRTLIAPISGVMGSILKLSLALIFALNIPFALVQPSLAFAKGKKSTSSKKDKSEDEKEPLSPPSPDSDDDDDGEGDPFMRFERATMKDQNCDPTFLLDLYRKYRLVNCLTSYTGICLDPTADEIFYGISSGLTTAGTSIGLEMGKNSAATVLKEQLALTHAQMAELKAGQTELVKEIQAVRAAYAAESAATAAIPATPESIAIAQVEKKITTGRLVRAVFKGGIRGLLIGSLVTVGWTFWDSEYREAITEYLKTSVISPVGCAAVDENDPNFKKYVPLEPGTCRTPIYTPGHPKVLAFLELPMPEKLKLLKNNRLVCGYYKSLNRELEQRIDKLNGKARIKNVTCNQGSGEIEFQSDQKDPQLYFKIRRNPKTKEIQNYSYEERDFGIVRDGATFDLLNQDGNIMVAKTSIYNHVSLSNEIIPNDRLVSFSNGQPEKAAKTFDAFRALRKYSRTLTLCCDTPYPELKEKLKTKPNSEKVRQEDSMLEGYNKTCHPAWFGRSAKPVPLPSDPTSNR
jgi:hypothetical protein